MYTELNHVNDKMAVSVKLDTACENGGFVKISGLADCKIGNFDLGGEALKGVALTDNFGDVYCIIATDYHRYDERILSGDIPKHEKGELVRGYLLEKGNRVTIEKALVTGDDIAVGDVLVPTTSGTTLAKSKGTEKNAVAQVIEIRKYMKRDCYKIMFI